jgi:hypothetical protein
LAKKPQHAAEKEKRRYADCKARGVCPFHPSEPVIPNRVRCQVCRDYSKQRYETAKKTGMCFVHPASPVVPGKRSCQKCVDGDKLRRVARKVRGVCPSHPQELSLPNRSNCWRCARIQHHYGVKKRNLTDDLDEQRFRWLVAQPCIYCGLPNSGGVDRVKNEYGYTLLNSVPCCAECNMAKRKASAPEYLNLCARVIAHNSTYLAFKARWIETRTGGPDCQFSSTTAIPVVDQPSLSNSIH